MFFKNPTLCDATSKFLIRATRVKIKQMAHVAKHRRVHEVAPAIDNYFVVSLSKSFCYKYLTKSNRSVSTAYEF